LFDLNSLVAVGDSGIILKTEDGGTHWSKLNSNTSKALRSVHFVDENTGWAVGDSGTILHTNNGGNSWSTQSDTIINLRSVHFINYNTGYIAGDLGRGYKTNNGGSDWSSHYFGYDYMFNCITFINEDTGWVFSSDRDIFITTDKGENWNKQTGVGNSQRIYSASFIGKVGYAAGNYGTIINTTNGGVIWQRQYVTNNLYLSVPLFAVHFIDKYNGWAVGDGGIVLRTTDGGGAFVTSSEENISSLPDKYELFQNYPNPFNPTTKISYALPQNSFVELKVFNLLGQEIATLVNQEKPAGYYQVDFNASSLPSGVYFYQLNAGEFVITKKMLLLK
jgi:photosystem II stability/assembly factor-like uncharacterized protein